MWLSPHSPEINLGYGKIEVVKSEAINGFVELAS